MDVSTAAFVASILDKVRSPAIPYVRGGRSAKGTDCINLIGWCMDDLGGRKVSSGSNTAWRNDMDVTWTLADAKKYGGLIPGALVYIRDAPTAKWPDGDYSHVGVYVGPVPGLITPDGKQGEVVHASASRGGVYASTLKNGWTHVAWLLGLAYDGGGLGAGPQEYLTDEGAAEGVDDPYATLPTADPAWPKIGTVIATNGLDVKMRASPKDSEKLWWLLPVGTQVSIMGITGDWYKIAHEGRTGYMMQKFVRME